MSAQTHIDEQRSNMFDLHNMYGSNNNVLRELSQRLHSENKHSNGTPHTNDLGTLMTSLRNSAQRA